MALGVHNINVLTGQTGAGTVQLVGVTAGSCVIVIAASWVNNGQPITAVPTATGHTFASLGTGWDPGDNFLAAWAAPNSPGGTITIGNVDVAGTSPADITIVGVEITSAATVSPVEDYEMVERIGTSAVSGTINPTEYPAQCICATAHSGTDTTIGVEAGWTTVRKDEGGSSHMPIAVAYKEIASGTEDCTFTFGASRTAGILSFAIKPSAAPAARARAGQLTIVKNKIVLPKRRPVSIGV